MTHPESIEEGRVAALRAAVAAEHAAIDRTVAFLHAHPELAHEERAAAAFLAGALGDRLEVRTGFAGLPTAFTATVRGRRPGPVVGLVAVYDAVAVPDGDGGLAARHSCGHGPISGAVVGAARALAGLDDLAGTIVVVGAPADELVSPGALREGGGKTRGLAAGLWEGLDAALYVHPESHTGVWRASRWLRLIEVETAADAARALPAGAFALGDVEERPDGSLRGILRVLGADAAEVEDRTAVARALLAPSRWRVLGTAEGLVADPRVAAVAERALQALGIGVDPDIPPMPFSTDFGNVSRRVPAAMIGLGDPDGWRVHEAEGERRFRSADGIALAHRAAAVLAVTADALAREGAPA